MLSGRRVDPDYNRTEVLPHHLSRDHVPAVAVVIVVACIFSERRRHLMELRGRVVFCWTVLSVVGLGFSGATLLEGNDDAFERYVIVPPIPSQSSGEEYFHVYITADGDTSVDVTLHGTYLYRAARLTEKNDWSWHENIRLSSDLKTSAYSKGFDVVADRPVTILVTFNSSLSPSLVTYTAFPLPKRSNAEYMIGSSETFTNSMFLVATGRRSTTIKAYGPWTSTPTISDLAVEEYTVYRYRVEEPRNVNGFRVTCSTPAAVYGGHPVPGHDEKVSISLFYQVPPVHRLGSLFVAGPLAGWTLHDSYSLLIVPRHETTLISLAHSPDHRPLQSRSSCSCAYNSSESCTVVCEGGPLPDPHVDVRSIEPDHAAVVRCSDPCLVFTVADRQLGAGHADLSESMALVAPPSVAPGGLHFFVPSTCTRSHAGHARVNIAVPTAYADGLLVDGLPTADLGAVLKHTTTTVSAWSVLTLTLPTGNHRVIHQMAASVPIAVHVYGEVFPLAGRGRVASAFGFPAVYPAGHSGEIPPGGDERAEAEEKSHEEGSSTATLHHPSLAVAGVILLIAVFITVLAIVVIGIKNSALLRVIIYGHEMSWKEECEEKPKNKHDLDQKAEVQEKQTTGYDQGQLYLVPTPTTVRVDYEPVTPAKIQTELNDDELNYDTIT